MEVFVPSRLKKLDDALELFNMFVKHLKKKPQNIKPPLQHHPYPTFNKELNSVIEVLKKRVILFPPEDDKTLHFNLKPDLWQK